MPAKAMITTPFPTVQETAKEMGVTEKRVRQLERLMTAIVEGCDRRVVRTLTRTANSRAKRRAKRGVTKRKRIARQHA